MRASTQGIPHPIGRLYIFNSNSYSYAGPIIVEAISRDKDIWIQERRIQKEEVFVTAYD